MRTYTTKHTVYSFNELSEEAQQKALCMYSDAKSQDYEQDYVLDYETEKLQNIGFEDVEINYTGFWSQGDGASFEAKSLDIKKFIEDIKIKDKFLMVYNNAEEINASVDRNTYHYYHENTVTAVVDDLDAQDNISEKRLEQFQEEVADFEQYLGEWVKDKCQDIYQTLENDWDYQFSPECLTEDIEANEYEFTKDGELV